ncbi:LexA repressor [Betaproteobacteria bacterium]|nr:LexA repressor [Betaproteobacteria bacterium]GHU22499.1 LexA repressor [Betaproteobacteria bacterium]
MLPIHKPLTARQQEILEFICRSTADTGRPPTRTELCTAFGFHSPNAAQSHLRALAAKGAIILDDSCARGIRLPDGAPSADDSPFQHAFAPLPACLPLIGHVAAGSPMLAVEHIERHLALDPALFAPRADYLLRVRGMSMRDAGILDGDLLAVHHTAEARNGQIVVARLDDEVTVKTWQRKEHTVELLPANPDFAPIVVDLRRQTLALEGVMVGLIRRD